ncbi:3'-5' exonuclease [Gymnodinialimonas ulvae]|uniref:3'-5' exonuclease n=1 Tax=Gymnodinialimonas ulvae TaxID=3126504 RepID=UPI0030AA2E2E
MLSWLFGRRVIASKRGALDLPDGPFRFVALDVETANGNVASICQIGIACVGFAGEMSVHSTLVNPKQAFDPFNTGLHGIDAHAVKTAPDFPRVYTEIAPLLGQHLIFQHSSFDRRAIYASCEAHGVAEPDWLWADSVQVARRAWPEFKGNGGHGLAHLKRALDLEFTHHDAGEDAKAAALVVLAAERKTGARLEELIGPKPRPPKVKRVQSPPADVASDG